MCCWKQPLGRDSSSGWRGSSDVRARVPKILTIIHMMSKTASTWKRLKKSARMNDVETQRTTSQLLPTSNDLMWFNRSFKKLPMTPFGVYLSHGWPPNDSPLTPPSFLSFFLSFYSRTVSVDSAPCWDEFLIKADWSLALFYNIYPSPWCAWP